LTADGNQDTLLWYGGKMKQGIALVILFCIFSCTGPLYRVVCINNTEYYAAVALNMNSTTHDEVFVNVFEPNTDGSMHTTVEGEFSWIVRLHSNEGEIFADSGEVFIADNDDRCTIERLSDSTYSIIWEE
jgi:hypothetical protein